MATLTSKKKTIEEMAEEINRGAKSSSSSVSSGKKNAVSNASAKSSKDSSLFDAYMKNQSYTSKNSNPSSYSRSDESTIKSYEAIPNYNIFQRLVDKSKADSYKRKQSMLPIYKEAKSRTMEKSLKQSGLTDSELEALTAGTFGNKSMVGLDLISAYINRDKRKSALEKLKNSGSRSFSASDILDYAQSQSRKKETQELSDFSDKHKVLGTALTFPMNAGGGVSGLVGNTVDYLTGNPIDPENYANHNTNTSNQMRSAVSDDMGKAGQFLYNVGTSIGDSLTSQALSGFKPAYAAALQGSQAFTNSAIDSANRGLSPNQIMATSSVAAAAETVFEKLSLDNLKGILKGGTAKEAGKSLFKDILSQAKKDAGEEIKTEIVNEIADRIFNDDLSNFVHRTEQYQNTGMSEDDSKKQAWKDLFGQIAYAGAAGAVSGGIMGGGASLINKIRGNSNISSNINENNTDSSVENSSVADTNIEPSVMDTQELIKREPGKLSNAFKRGIMPEQTAKNFRRVDISQDAYQDIASTMKKSNTDSSVETFVKNMNEKFFGEVVDTHDIAIDDTKVGNYHYRAELNKNSMEKIINDGPISLEKMSVISDIDNVLSHAEYIGSKRQSNSNSGVTGYDYFKSQINLNGEDFTVTFEVEVKSDSDSGRKNRVINKIDIENVNGESITSPEVISNSHVETSNQVDYNNNVTDNNVSLSNRGDIDVINNEQANERSRNETAGNLRYSSSGSSGNDIEVERGRTDGGTDTSLRGSFHVINENSRNTVNVNGSAENVHYNSKKIDGFEELNSALDRLVGMYKGNENTQSMYEQMKSAINEYLQTYNQDAIDRALNLAADIDNSLVGHSYTRKGSGKGGAKAQNNRVTTTFSEGEFVDTILAYGKELRNTARGSQNNQSQPNAVHYENLQNDKNTVSSDMVERIRVARENLRAGESSNQRVRGYNETLVNKTDAPQELKNEFINNPDLYTQLSNKDTLARANEILANNDIDSAINQYRILLDKKDPVAVPLGYNLSKQLSQSGMLDESVQLVRDMSRALTESGQFSQAAAITLMNNDPEAAKRYLIREIDTLNQKGKEKYGKKWTDFELTESELHQFNKIKSGDTDAIKSAYEAVYDRLRKQYPSTMTEKLMEFRRMSMLLNARTNVRNVVSNALLFPVRWTADRVSALGEGVYSLINPKYSRTQSINPIRSKQSKKLASEAFETVKSELLGDNKYEDSKGAIRDKQVFKESKTAQMLDTLTGGAITKANQAMGKSIDPSLLETARNFTYYLLEKGDNVFVKKNFESRMASYLDAQGITELENIPADAYVLATQEAMKATFKDDTKLSKILSDVRRNLGVAGEIVLPFTKTPANLAMRGIDYSPAGALNGLNTIIKAKNNTDIAKGITQLGQSVTGTAAIALGYALAEAGLITGALSEDKDEAQFQKQQGMLPYAFKIGDNYFSYDWAQPASIPIILGVTLYDSWNNNGDAINGLKQGLLAAADSWLELSPLQNLSDIFGGYGTTAENVWSVLTTDTPLSFIPSQLGAAARIGDTTQRVTYDQTSHLNNLANQAKAKIPGLSQTLPVAYDTWGNPIQRQDSTGEAVFANLLNPGQLGNANVSPIDDEISSLYDSTGNASVFPKKASWSYKVNGENVKLNNEQYSEFQRIMGQNAYDMASSLINSDTYNALSDEQRVEAIADMYSFADALAKSEVLGYDVENSDTYKNTYSVYNEKGADGVATYFGIKQNLSGTKNADYVNAVNSLNISDEDKGYYLSKLMSPLSKSAQAAYEESGYAGIYQHYQQETMADRIKQLREQSAAERIKALREQSNSGVTDDMVQRIKELRSQL